MDILERILLIILIFVAFALSHSILVSNRAKRYAIKHFGEGIIRGFYRFTFTIISVVSIAIAMYFIKGLPDSDVMRLPLLIKIGFFALQFIGIIFIILPFKHIDIMEFIGFKQLFKYIKTGKVNGDVEGISTYKLITTGIYGIVRHPLYTGSILVITFNTNITVNLFVFAVLCDVYFIIGTFIEEKRLQKYYGNEYTNYMKKVPRFIPAHLPKGQTG
ncbi:MAG: isoprenylcysteine carboxylmethyltransferase family protein [Candidatus Magnetoovum sp. WYHC-5]|nr:isoprenylcysteine carboxylmethyltransferase family protein [Candidatus Magnetoovum sp. WYHC-5]